MLESWPDEVLVEEVRLGDDDAALVLWRRHVDGCRAVLSSVLDDPRAVDGSLRRSFARVVAEIRGDVDPLASFAVHLRTTVLLDACLGSVDHQPPSPMVRAFSRLSRLDQLLLWAWLVDDASRVDLALLGSVSPHDVPARLDEAQRRLRTGWIFFRIEERGQHECPWGVLPASGWRSRRYGPDIERRLQRHLDQCSSCRALAEEDERFPHTLPDALLRLPRPVADAGAVTGAGAGADDCRAIRQVDSCGHPGHPRRRT